MATTANPHVGADAATWVKKRKSLSIGITGAVVVAITLLECATIYTFLARGHSRGETATHKAVAAVKNGQLRDVDLGKFSLIATDPKSIGSLLIEFHLVGSLAAGNSGIEAKREPETDRSGGQENTSGDVTDDGNTSFEQSFQSAKRRFRDSVVAIVGNAQISAVSDPDLGAIKRQILARANSLLGKPLLKEIWFSDFAVVQQ
jgi:hypothetical protein